MIGAVTTPGCALWAVGFVLAGLLADSGWAALSSMLGRATLVGVFVLIVLSALRRRRVRSRSR
jgi:membrane protein DedA with SNARE-associated domain